MHRKFLGFGFGIIMVLMDERGCIIDTGSSIGTIDSPNRLYDTYRLIMVLFINQNHLILCYLLLGTIMFF